MNCRETREYLFAFLDNELDVPLSLEIQRHLEQCCDCAREAEIERNVRKHLAASFEAVVPETVLDEQRLMQSLKRESVMSAPIRSPMRRYWIWVAASVALLALVSGIVFQFSNRNPSDVSAEMLVDDFQRFLAEGKPVQIASDDSAQVAAWIHREMNMPVKLPVMHGKCKLVGARKCNLDGHVAALALYDMEGAPASLLVLSGNQPGLRANSGGNLVDHRKDHTVLAREHGGLMYAAVGRLSETQLAELIPQN